ncbi:MAG: bacitracin resistance protein BacA [Leptospiraceae bacterium]|nr:bacitracin resistance protein BacA [Leptospiraceae bacterium]
MERKIYVPPSGPPSGPPLSREIFKTLGEDKIRELVKVFYSLLKDSSIRGMFPENMDESEVKSGDFMIQILGGPAYYVQKYGPPRMRMRHIPFVINEKSRRVWLSCYKKALEMTEIPEKEKEEIWSFLVEFSKWMVNSDEEDTAIENS